MHFTISDYLLDVAQNSVEANSSIVEVTLNESGKLIEMIVTDNGCGMDRETLKKAVDPFFTDPDKHAARKAGFGLPFLMQACDACEGSFSISSDKGVGTEVRCSFGRDCIDTPPVGGIVSAVVALMTMDGDYELTFNRQRDDEEYQVKRSDLIDALEELETASSIAMARTFVTSLEENL